MVFELSAHGVVGVVIRSKIKYADGRYLYKENEKCGRRIVVQSFSQIQGEAEEQTQRTQRAEA